MPILNLNHYLIRAACLEKSRNFYVDVLGFSEQTRPNFPFPGYWLGVNGDIQVHIAPDDIANRELYYLGTPADAVKGQTGVIDHIAFLAKDHASFLQKLESLKVPFRPRFLKESRLFQVFLKDPDGITIELNFLDVDMTTDWGGENYDAMPRSSAAIVMTHRFLHRSGC